MVMVPNAAPSTPLFAMFFAAKRHMSSQALFAALETTAPSDDEQTRDVLFTPDIPADVLRWLDATFQWKSPYVN